MNGPGVGPLEPIEGYGDWKLASPPEDNQQEGNKCECDACFGEVTNDQEALQ